MTRERDSGVEAALHQECWERLPWLANETLAAREIERIEPHLRVCAECRLELESQQRLRTAMRSDESLVLAPQAGLQKLMQRLAAEEFGEQPETDSRQRAVERRAPRWARWAAAAAVVQLVALALLLSNMAEEAVTSPRFETLTGDSRPAPAADQVIRVVFASRAPLDEINRLLRSVEAQIIAGPSEAGVYTLALADDAEDSTPAIERALTRLRADPRVLFAESALARSAP